MKTRRSLLLLCIAFVWGLLCVTFASGQSTQQFEDDGYFNTYIYMSASGNYISASASSPVPDSYEEFFTYDVVGQPVWEVNGGNYHNSGQGNSFSTGPVPLGDSYDASFEFLIEYYYEDPFAGGGFDGGCQYYIDGQECRGTDSLVAELSLYLPAPPPIISTVAPVSVYQGQQGTLTVSGSNFVNHGGEALVLHISGGGSPFTQTGSSSTCTTGCTASFSFDFTGYSPGIYNVWISNDEAASEPVQFTVYVGNGSGGPAAPVDACAVSSNQTAGFTSIVPSGINVGTSGTFSVSFGGSDFAGINPTVAYGPYSTPESIAASMAAFITRNYARYGLTAKAFGRNVIYSGTATTSSGSGALGVVTNVFSGNGGVSSSFLENPSPVAPNEARMACESAAPPPPTSICGSDPGPRAPINVPAKITQARNLLSPRCESKFAVFPGYTTTKLFSTLNRAKICQYPNHRPQNDPIAYAATDVLTNSIDLLPDFYTDRTSNQQAITLLHEGIHLFGRGTLDDPTVQGDLGLPQTYYDTDNITRYILGGCNP